MFDSIKKYITDCIKQHLKRKQRELSDRKSSQALDEIMEKINQQVYPEGTSQMVREIREVSNIIHCDVKDLSEIYCYAANKVFISACSKEQLIKGIKAYGNILNEQQMEGLAHYVFSKLVKQRMGITDPNMIDNFLKGLGFVETKGDYDIIPGAYGEFGISITNPVPVNGIPCSETYLKRLVTEDDSSITWERQGNGGSPNIKEIIDIYKITDDMGRQRQTIYICPYHPHTSSLAPKGFKFK